MVNIELEYSEWINEIVSKNLDHFYFVSKNRYNLIAIDGPLVFKHTLDQDDVLDYETNYKALANKKAGNYYSREPFATKVLKDGSKLFRRKHGIKETILAGQEKDIVFTVPYAKARINKLEIIDANALDRVDLLVKSPVDTNIATAYGMPADYLLNQFGFNVVVSDLLYSDKSDYDAEVYQAMQVVVRYKNDSANDKEVGFNLIYHEVV